jgi:hypothetical protein
LAQEGAEGINVSNQATRLAEEAKQRIRELNRAVENNTGAEPSLSVALRANNEAFAAIDALLALVQPAVSEEAEMGDRSAGYAFTVKNPDTVWDNFLWRGQEIKRLRAELENCASRIHGQREEIVRLEAARAQSSSKGDEGMQHE